jgi:hypothetical protein
MTYHEAQILFEQFSSGTILELPPDAIELLFGVNLNTISDTFEWTPQGEHASNNGPLLWHDPRQIAGPDEQRYGFHRP